MTSDHITDHFTWAELTQTQTGLPNDPGPAERHELVQTAALLESVRALLGAPLRVTSGFRSRAVELAVSGKDYGQHRKGQAADFVPQGLDLHDAVAKVRDSRIPYDQLIFECPAGSGGWAHISHAGDKSPPRRMALAWDGKTYRPFTA